MTHDSPHAPDLKVKLADAQPFSRATMHRWMINKFECRYQQAERNYYTDSHEAPATKADMKER